MKIAIYSRKSKFTGKGESIENQILKCKQFITFKFEDIKDDDVEIFIDEGFSGKNEDRPRYQDMLKKIKNKDIDKVIIYQLNRLGRNARDIHNTMQMCDDFGCIIYSATEGFDSSTSFGRAVIGILASLAQLEREQLAERVKDNMYTLAKMGRWLGGHAPIGFDGVKEMYIDENGNQRYISLLKPNKEELKRVKLIYDKYLEFQSVSKVAKWANQNSVHSKNNNRINKSSIVDMLKNPVYVKSSPEVFDYLKKQGYECFGEPNGKGILRYGNGSIAAVGRHMGVIEADMWIKIQNIIALNTDKAPKRGKTKVALLSGVLKCKCGGYMRVIYGTPNKQGVKPFYYSCGLKIDEGISACSSKNINGKELEKHFIDYLKNYSKDELIEKLNSELKKSTESSQVELIQKIKNDISKCDSEIKSLFNKLKLTDDDEISKLIMNEIKLENKKIKELTIEKDKLENAQQSVDMQKTNIEHIIDRFNYFQTVFDELDFESKQRLINELISEIKAEEDKFVVTFNTLQIRPNSFCKNVQSAINIIDLYYKDLSESTFALRFKKAKLYANMSQEQLASATNLSRSTINDLECGYREEISLDTLQKLLTVLDKKILCDDYCLFILNQREKMAELMTKYTVKELSTKLQVDRTTIYKYKDCKSQIKRETFKKIDKYFKE